MQTDQLQVMVRNVRAECGHALSIAQGVNQVDTLKYLLQRTQVELWTAFIWPELNIRAPVDLVAGQYRYPYPANVPFDCIREAWTSQPGSIDWQPVDYGIPSEVILPDESNDTRSDPVRAWASDGAMFRVYPTPDTGALFRFVGQKPLEPFLADSDVSTLDSTTIVLFTAADLLARAKAEDAASKMQKAQRHLVKLLGNKVSAKNKVSTLGGGAPRLNSASGRLTMGRGF